MKGFQEVSLEEMKTVYGLGGSGQPMTTGQTLTVIGENTMAAAAIMAVIPVVGDAAAVGTGAAGAVIWAAGQVVK